MKIEYGTAQDIASWIDLVQRVSWNFPGLETKEKIERIIYYLPENIHEGSILVYENEEYRIDSDLEMSRRESLRERIDRLKALKNLKKEEEIEETE